MPQKAAHQIDRVLHPDHVGGSREVEETDAIRAATIGEVCSRVQMLASGTSKRKDIVACRDFLALPDCVAEFEIERRALSTSANGGEIVLLSSEIMR